MSANDRNISIAVKVVDSYFSFVNYFNFRSSIGNTKVDKKTIIDLKNIFLEKKVRKLNSIFDIGEDVQPVNIVENETGTTILIRIADIKTIIVNFFHAFQNSIVKAVYVKVEENVTDNKIHQKLIFYIKKVRLEVEIFYLKNIKLDIIVDSNLNDIVNEVSKKAKLKDMVIDDLLNGVVENLNVNLNLKIFNSVVNNFINRILLDLLKRKDFKNSVDVNSKNGKVENLVVLKKVLSINSINKVNEINYYFKKEHLGAVLGVVFIVYVKDIIKVRNNFF